MATRNGIRGYSQIKADLEKMQKAPATVLKRTLSDVKKRGPSWIAKGVSQEYNITAKEITGQKVGTLRFRGDGVKDLKLIYSGRFLTPTHFGMRPKNPPANGRAYTLSYKIKRNGQGYKNKVKPLTAKQRSNLALNFQRKGTQTSQSSPYMLIHTGNKKAGGTDHIPFQRTGKMGRKMDYVVKRTTLPSMVTEGKNGPMREKPAAEFNAGLEKRLNNHMKLLEK